eukprot:3554216-Amphidinium_carterae.1
MPIAVILFAGTGRLAHHLTRSGFQVQVLAFERSCPASTLSQPTFIAPAPKPSCSAFYVRHR